MADDDTLLVQMHDASARLTRALQDTEALIQQGVAVLGSRGVQFGVQADELLATALQNLRLNEHYAQQIAHKLAQANELARITALLNSSLRLNEVLQEVMDTIIHLTGATRAYLMLQENGALTIRIARNWDRETLSAEEIIFSRGIVQAALENG